MKQLFSEIPYIKSERLILRKIEDTDAEALSELTNSPNVYRYLPTFLFEQKYEDIHYVIRHLYDECSKESIILGVFMEEEFCGLAEIYGYRENMHKASIGCRFLERCWGKGIATEAVGAIRSLSLSINGYGCYKFYRQTFCIFAYIIFSEVCCVIELDYDKIKLI